MKTYFRKCHVCEVSHCSKTLPAVDKVRWGGMLLVLLGTFFVPGAANAQTCDANSCVVQYQVTGAQLDKCGFQEFTNEDLPRIHIYHDQITHVTDDYSYPWSWTDADECSGMSSLSGSSWTWEEFPGSYSGSDAYAFDVTKHEKKTGTDCFYTNTFSGGWSQSGSATDGREYDHDVQTAYVYQRWRIKDFSVNWSDVGNAEYLPDANGAMKWYFVDTNTKQGGQTQQDWYNQYWHYVDLGYTNCSTNLASLDFIGTPIVDDPTHEHADVFYTNQEYIVTSGGPPCSMPASNYVDSTHSTIELQNEYTDWELYTNIVGLMPAYSGVWYSGDDFWQTVAYSGIAASHKDGQTPFWATISGQAELQKMSYRFEIPGSEMFTEYRITWDLVTYDVPLGQVINIAHGQTNIIGNGADLFTDAFEEPAPWWDQSDIGGYVFTFVSNVHVAIVPRGTVAGAGTPGTGPDWSAGTGGSGCSSCGGGGNGALGGSGSPYGGIYAAFSLGRATPYLSAGELNLWSPTPISALSTPAALSLTTANPEVEVIEAGDQLRQINAPQALADIVVSNAYAYRINFYLPSQVGSLVGGVHQLTGSPFITWLISNPDGASATNRLQLTKIEGSDVSVFEADYTASTGTWKFEYPGGLHEDEVQTVQSTNELGLLTTVTTTTRVPGGPDQYKVRRVYQMYSPDQWTVPQGPYLVEETLDPDNDPRTTTYTYNWGGYANGTTIPLQSVVYPDGSWKRYDVFDSQGRPGIIYSPQQNVTLANYGSQPTDLEYPYYDPGYVNGSGDDGSVSPNTPRMIQRYVNGLPSVTFTAFPSQYERLDIVCPPSSSGSWDDSQNLVTTTMYYSTGPNTNRVQSILHPDGTMQIYDYAQAADGSVTNIVYSGVPNAGHTAIVDGTKTITVLGPVGQMISKTEIDIASDITLSRETYGDYDEYSRPQSVTYLDGTSNITAYACCGVDFTIDRDGAVTQYHYDADKRQVATTRLGVTTSNILDSVGHVLKTVRIGSDNSVITLSQSQYDLSGQLIAETNALNGVTTYSESTNSIGGLIRTTTYPDGGTRIEEYNLDQSLASVTGTAVHGQVYGYGSETAQDANMNCGYTVITNLDQNGNPTTEWTKTYSDPSGRVIETCYPGDGYYDANWNYYYQPNSRSYYNTAGQLWKSIDPDGVTTFNVYNARGEVAYTIQAVDDTTRSISDYATLTNSLSGILSGVDRVTMTTNDVIVDHGTDVHRTRTYVWLDGQSSGTLTSASETSTDGLKSWQVMYADSSTAVTNQSVTTYSGNSRTVVDIAPDGSYTINAYSFGQLTSSTRYDSGSQQIGGTTYAYDAQGRQYQTTDARNGATTYGYNHADQVTAVTTPNPGNGGSSETTTTLYDNMMRPYEVIQPDGTEVYSEYLLTGELGRQYGSRTYPVAYRYDYAGRMQTMTNWSDFGSSSGARVTTWNYDDKRGWLAHKVYDDGHGPTYTYTPGGRLQTRAWVRTDANGNPITTTNNYDYTGSLTNVCYSDSTPAVTNSYDRLGRLSSVVCNGMTDTLTYNLAGALLGESYSGGVLNGLAVTNGYDQFMRRTKLSALSAGSQLTSANYGYDEASRLSTVDDNSGNTATYGYLANSPLVNQITFKHNGATRMTTTKQYDYLNRLTQISSQPSGSGAPPLSFNYTYNPANQRTKDTLADGSYWAYQYDSLGQVTGGKKYWADGTPVAGQQFGYAFDDIGNRTQTQSGGDQTGGNLRTADYSVNDLNQITQRDYPGTNDIIGVALATNDVTVNGQTAYRHGEYFWADVQTNNTASAKWQGVTVASGGTINTGGLFVPKTPEQFSYDSDGNLTNDGHWNYTWDAENRLIQMTVNTNVGPQYQLTFAYDPKGRRIEKTVALNGTPVSTNRFLYDGWNLVAILDPQSSLLQSFAWGTDLSGSMQGAGGVGGLLEVSDHEGGTTNCFPAYDGNGNVVALINANDGTTVANYAYGPFGETIRMTGPMAKGNPFRFSTKYQDDESDLLYYGHRYCNPSTGTWLSRDPITNEQGLNSGEEFGGVNLYCFVANNACNGIDSLGLALYAIDGTWMKRLDQANPWQLYVETTERPRRYWAGPANGITGSDLTAIALEVYFQIQSDYCAAKLSGSDLTINLTGWSRGSMIAALIAKTMNDVGFVCPECNGSKKRYQPVKVNWVGLFDAVAMTKNVGFPTSVPPNVAHFDHAMKTKHFGKQAIFPTWHFSGANERYFDNHDGTLTTHADIGMSVIRGNHNDAYPWIKEQAISAGVGF